MGQPFRPVEVERVGPARRIAETDRAATEEPMEIRLHGEPFAVIMRTPGADRELTAGFLLAEQVIRSAGDLGAIEDGAVARQPGWHNVVRVTLAGDRIADLTRLLEGRRQVAQHSSCGLCGRRTIASLGAVARPIQADWNISARLISSFPGRLRAAQAVFDETGGLHAAGLFDREGRLALLAEDVGRHSAVDKLIGRALLTGELPLHERALMVSGRASFELTHKAVAAGIPLMAAVSAPSSLAIHVAHTFGLTLVGFLRGERFNVYAGGERVVEDR